MVHSTKAKSAINRIRVKDGKKANIAMPNVYDAHAPQSILPDRTEFFRLKTFHSFIIYYTIKKWLNQ